MSKSRPHAIMTTIRLTPEEEKHICDETAMKARCCVARMDAPEEYLVTFEFLNKGAANVVFKLHPWSPISSITPCLFIDFDSGSKAARPVHRQHVINQVVRVPRGLSKHLSSEEIIDGFEHAIRPLFLPGNHETVSMTSVPRTNSGTSVQKASIPIDQDFTKHLMDHQGVLLLPEVMEHLVNESKEDTFGNSGPGRCLGILLPDMSPLPGRSITLEIKPKWLSQSPNAPVNAVRCRTCAMQVTVPKNRETYVCPLRLVHGGSTSLRSWAHTMVTRQFGGHAHNSSTEPVISSIISALLDYLTAGEGRDLLRHLLKLQNALDAQGVLCRPPKGPLFDYNLRLAMTLRDCSLFVQVPYDAAAGRAIKSQITSKLADLDFKSAEKIEDWTDKERKLLDDGTYTAASNGVDCWLKRV
ncbi:hypothetical protein EJ02DRAFT_453163 [Clathrospora elynae]|uniref:Inositol-pentakisphosphate 2-kinase n=1 Tax=Clathrospora elynae TaxID=706981 RepID=A0A6A5SYQ4_9PLEO|nr:hypothetical protein EJ02DRAFT_453163 [Clathrospora elynae]